MGGEGTCGLGGPGARWISRGAGWKEERKYNKENQQFQKHFFKMINKIDKL